MTSPEPVRLTDDEHNEIIDAAYGATMKGQLIGPALAPVVERILAARTAAARADERRKVLLEAAEHAKGLAYRSGATARRGGVMSHFTREPNTGEPQCECDEFHCPYAPTWAKRCPPSICDCFIETHPDSPFALHPEDFVVKDPS